MRPVLCIVWMVILLCLICQLYFRRKRDEGTEILLNKRWVLKSRDKETYYKLRDALGELRKFTTEKMGCQIIDNSLLIKMEKIPVIPESFMGIQKFSSKKNMHISVFC